ncbi:MAG: hypothetical protein PHI28_01350 [Mangrovibacterium sp.]|nr:hypothetical protein [Mangrovibacterium sp.]
MDRHAFLAWTSGSQWILFLAMILIIFSWVEQKKGVQPAGHILFVLLGIFSLWMILSGQIAVPKVPNGQIPSAEVKALTYFSGLVITGAMGLAALLLKWCGSKWVKLVNGLLVAFALLLFFMVYQLQRQA